MKTKHSIPAKDLPQIEGYHHVTFEVADDQVKTVVLHTGYGEIRIELESYSIKVYGPKRTQKFYAHNESLSGGFDTEREREDFMFKFGGADKFQTYERIEWEGASELAGCGQTLGENNLSIQAMKQYNEGRNTKSPF